MADITLPFTNGWGLIQGWASVARQDIKVQRFIFKIDTASSWTLLLDEDFISICASLGWDRSRYPDIINWIRLNPQFFEEEIGGAYCIAGRSEAIFRIKDSYIYLLNSAGNVPRRWGPPQLLLRGSFSTQFLNFPEDERGRASHFSLLGVDKLNELRQFVWAYPRKITLFR
jgi:hypothetical protein